MKLARKLRLTHTDINRRASGNVQNTAHKTQGSHLKNIRSAAFGLVVALAAFTITAPAHATVVLDQSQTVAGFQRYIDADGQIGQSFTIGTTGVLDHVDVKLRKTFPGAGPATDYDIQLSIQGLSSGLPDGIVLASAIIDGSLLPDAPATSDPLTVFDLSAAGLTVTAGETYAFVLTGLGGASVADFNVLFTNTNPYAGGSELFFNGVNWSAQASTDIAFETFVDTSGVVVAVPEPASLALFGLGMIGLSALRRRGRTI